MGKSGSEAIIRNNLHFNTCPRYLYISLHIRCRSRPPSSLWLRASDRSHTPPPISSYTFLRSAKRANLSLEQIMANALTPCFVIDYRDHPIIDIDHREDPIVDIYHRNHPIIANHQRNNTVIATIKWSTCVIAAIRSSPYNIATVSASTYLSRQSHHRDDQSVGHVSSRRSASNIYIRNNKFTIIHHRDNQSSHIYHRRQSHSTIHIRNNQPSLDHSFRAPEPPSASIAAIAASPCRTTIHSAPPSPRTLDASLIGRPRIPKALPPADSHYRNEHIWLMSNRLNYIK